MAKARVKFTFPPEQIREPIIWEVGKRFDLMTNIRRADGEKQDLEQGLKWVEERGVRVDPIEDSIIEG